MDFMDQEIIQQLSQFIVIQILKQPRRIITPDERIISTGLVDSFSLVDLALYVEETFNVRIHDTELNPETFDTVLQLAALIQERQSG
jgi:acyl carrier protein